MREKRKSNFGGRISQNVKNQKEANRGFGYINLPEGVKLLKLEEDTSRIDLDFLPYEVTDPKHLDRDDKNGLAQVGDLWYRKPFKVHRYVGENNDTVVCLRTFGKPCPICEHREKLIKDGATKDVFKEFYPRSRSLYPVIPIGVKGFKEDITLWDMSDELFQKILNEELAENPDDDNFPNLEDGKTLTLKIRWESIGKNKFPEVRNISFHEREPYNEDILDDVPKLDELFKVLSYEELSAKFFDLDMEDDGGGLKDVDNEDEPPQRTRGRSERSERSEKEERPERSSTRQERTTSREDKDTDEDKPTRSRPSKEEKSERPSRERSSSNEKDKCPHGHKFGVDAEDFKECDTCKVWGDCLDAKEGK